MGHLVLSRKLGETIMVGEIPVKVIRIAGGTVRLAIDAPRQVKILRGELQTQGLRNEAEKTSVAPDQHGQAIKGAANRQAKAAGLIAQVQAAARRRSAAGQTAGTAEACPAGAATGGGGESEGGREQAA